MRIVWLALLSAAVLLGQPTQAQDESGGAPLVFPGLLAKELREAGNPLATLSAMRELEARYLESPVFAEMFPEVLLNYEQFLGVPDAGPRAMQLPSFRSAAVRADPDDLAGFEPRSAVDVIAQRAGEARIVVFGEEHHLPQTRSIYEPLLRRLWDLGYRYLAAETFSERVMDAEFARPDYRSGYYLMDPVYSSAVRVALQLGYRLVAYDTAERSPTGEVGFRDRRQAENLVERIFDGDPQARVLVLAGRGHAAEVPPGDGWTPMASVLKDLTGIDPFTVYAPTMSERLTREEEHPQYRAAVDDLGISQPTIFVDPETGATFGSGNCDAHAFWPRVTIEEGRPDWLRTTLKRTDVTIPAPLRVGDGLRLVQVFAKEDSESAIPIDQVLLTPGRPLPVLCLPSGSYWARVVSPLGTIASVQELEVE